MPVLIYYVNKRDIPWAGVVQMLTVSYILGIVTLLISLFCHTLFKDFKKSMIISILISEAVYLTTSLIYGLVIDVDHRADFIMWLPVMIIFMIPFTLPMPLAISYGTGFIISKMKGRDIQT
jgi:hypothetical protein